MERNAQTRNFNLDGDSIRVYLLSTRAGGLGINLHRANVVIILDSDWNPQVDKQAMDRVHRIGQRKEVFVYRLVTEDSIEMLILDRQLKKLQLDYLIVEKSRGVKDINDADIDLSNIKDEDLEDIAFHGIDNILQISSKRINLKELDIDKLIQDSEDDVRKKKEIIQNQIKEIGKKAFEIFPDRKRLRSGELKKNDEKREKMVEIKKFIEKTSGKIKLKMEHKQKLKNPYFFHELAIIPQSYQFFDDRHRLYELRLKHAKESYMKVNELPIKNIDKMTPDEIIEQESLEKSGFSHWNDNEILKFYNF